MAAVTRRITCLGCSTVFRFRSFDRLAKRIGLHKCWEPAPKLKTYADTFGEPDRDWRPRDASA